MKRRRGASVVAGGSGLTQIRHPSCGPRHGSVGLAKEASGWARRRGPVTLSPQTRSPTPAMFTIQSRVSDRMAGLGLRQVALWAAVGAFLWLTVGGAGCKELSDTLDQANEQTASSQRAVPKAAPKQPVEAVTAAPEDLSQGPKWSGERFKSGTPEARARRAVIRRLECEDRVCSRAALHRIRKLRDALGPGLNALFSKQDARISTEAIRLAGLLKLKSAVQALGAVAAGGGRKLSKEAIWSLGEIATDGAAAELQRLVLSGVGLEERQQICEALGRAARPSSVRVLTELSRDAHPGVRESAAEALGATRAQEAIAPLVKAAKDPERAVREAARTALGLIPGARAKAALSKLTPAPHRRTTP